jgi:hypothetical protein
MAAGSGTVQRTESKEIIMTTTPLKPRFLMGSIVATPGALELLESTGVSPAVLLVRHSGGDWGHSLPAEDARANDYAVDHEERILSAYQVGESCLDKVWIITEWDRSVTTILLPEDY